jgi:hypothetical protein
VVLKLNPKWSHAKGKAGEDVLRAAILDYARSASSVPKVLGVWARTATERPDVYTLIEDDDGAERALYELELLIIDKWPQVEIRFHVCVDREALERQVTGAEPILLAA